MDQTFVNLPEEYRFMLSDDLSFIQSEIHSSSDKYFAVLPKDIKGTISLKKENDDVIQVQWKSDDMKMSSKGGVFPQYYEVSSSVTISSTNQVIKEVKNQIDNLADVITSIILANWPVTAEFQAQFRALKDLFTQIKVPSIRVNDKEFDRSAIVQFIFCAIRSFSIIRGYMAANYASEIKLGAFKYGDYAGKTYTAVRDTQDPENITTQQIVAGVKQVHAISMSLVIMKTLSWWMFNHSLGQGTANPFIRNVLSLLTGYQKDAAMSAEMVSGLHDLIHCPDNRSCLAAMHILQGDKTKKISAFVPMYVLAFMPLKTDAQQDLRLTSWPAGSHRVALACAMTLFAHRYSVVQYTNSSRLIRDLTAVKKEVMKDPFAYHVGALYLTNSKIFETRIKKIELSVANDVLSELSPLVAALDNHSTLLQSPIVRIYSAVQPTLKITAIIDALTNAGRDVQDKIKKLISDSLVSRELLNDLAEVEEDIRNMINYKE